MVTKDWQGSLDTRQNLAVEPRRSDLRPYSEAEKHGAEFRSTPAFLAATVPVIFCTMLQVRRQPRNFPPDLTYEVMGKRRLARAQRAELSPAGEITGTLT